MSLEAFSRPDLLASAAETRVLDVFGTAEPSGVSAFATSPVWSSATSAAAANAVRPGLDLDNGQ